MQIFCTSLFLVVTQSILIVFFQWALRKTINIVVYCKYIIFIPFYIKSIQLIAIQFPLFLFKKKMLLPFILTLTLMFTPTLHKQLRPYIQNTEFQYIDADWNENHVVLLLPAPTPSNILFKTVSGIIKEFKINQFIVKIKTHPTNTPTNGFLYLLSNADKLYRFDISTEGLKLISNNVVDFCVDQSRDTVYYIQNKYKLSKQTLGQQIKEFINSGNDHFEVWMQDCQGGILSYMQKKNDNSLMKKQFMVYNDQAFYETQELKTISGVTLQSSNSNFGLSNYTAFQTYSRNLNKTLFAVSNQILLWDESGELMYQKQLDQNIMCAEYSGKYLGLITVNKNFPFKQFRFKVIDWNEDKTVFEQSVLDAEEPYVCEVKFFEEVNKFTLGYVGTDTIYELDLENIQQNASQVKNTNSSQITEGDQQLQNTEPEKPVQTQEKKKNETVIGEIIKSQEFKESVKTAGSSLSVVMNSPFSNLGLKRLFISIDDFWPYSYHSEVYPESIEDFIQDCSIGSMLRINPVEELNLTQFKKFESSNNKIALINAGKFKQKNPRELFFMLSVRQVYTINLGISIAMYIISCLVRWVAYKIKKCCTKNQLEESPKKKQKQFSCKFWVLISAFFFTNTNNFLFYSWLQLQFSGFGQFYEKLNFLFTATMLMVCIIINLSLNFFIYSWYSASEVCESAQENYKGVVLQTISMNVRNCLRGTVHGVLLFSHYNQMICLMSIDILILLLCFKMRRYYRNKAVVVLSFGYLLGFLAFDGLLFFYTYFNELLQIDYEFAMLIVIFIILGCSIVLMLLLLLINLVEFIKERCSNNNKVSNDLESPEFQINEELKFPYKPGASLKFPYKSESSLKFPYKSAGATLKISNELNQTQKPKKSPQNYSLQIESIGSEIAYIQNARMEMTQTKKIK